MTDHNAIWAGRGFEFGVGLSKPMTDIPDELVERVCEIMCCEGLCGNEIVGQKCARSAWSGQAQAAIRAVLDWQENE